ncbi:anti-sigma regulatory factor [Spirosoma utsteinense]|uniref:Serine/threonine-protein kinase RsbT n=1 Tax=Spirosoma utsteinense TaxID=2585773 RepID=A0ABR6W9H0_9BACT|nr:anti-sigma regulatory factor [Spirosoma utsteinense]MBC3787618.1 serine/threonine-protein kinase RsbT [Spirosoma utsteinense]MBC3793214.1 serine/threonine-protein kinase RsbT [Spirosoma utsteinense]
MTNPAMIDVEASETLAVRQESDVIQLTSYIRQQVVLMGMSTLNQTKLSTASSELARNMLIHGGGGTVQVEQISMKSKKGIRLIFTDNGPGIADIEQAMQSGYSTGSGMGLGLPGARQLADEFQLTSAVEEGTTVTILKWAND